MRLPLLTAVYFFLLTCSHLAMSDELTQMAQQEMQALGFEIDNTDGEATTETVIAISKFQAENGLEVTGEASPQMIGVLRALASQDNASVAPGTTEIPMTVEEQEAELKARQQECLQEKHAAAQERKKKKRGVMRLLGAVSRTSSQLGNSDLSRATHEVRRANHTANDLEAAGKDLDLSSKEIEECRNPK
jgi:peptidoglycan hydrolase-like protein with peptidoglycan-binding domain